MVQGQQNLVSLPCLPHAAGFRPEKGQDFSDEPGILIGEPLPYPAVFKDREKPFSPRAVGKKIEKLLKVRSFFQITLAGLVKIRELEVLLAVAQIRSDTQR